MADNSLIHDDCLDDSDEGFEQGDVPPGGPGDDPTLPPLVRVQKYAQSGNIFDRQMVARIIPNLFRTAPEGALTQDLPEIMRILTGIGNESLLRVDLLEQIPHIAAQAVECSDRVSALKNIVSEYLIPLVVRNLGSSDTSLDKAAHGTLVKLVEHGFITKFQAEIQVCPSILALSKVETVAEINTGAVTLMSKLAPLLGRDIVERVFLKRFSELCSSHIFYVRKVCATHFGDFCCVVGKDAFEKVLLPCYIMLCKDDIWGVRKASAEAATFVSCACTPIARKLTLAPLFISLLQDSCRWVRMSAFQALGPFISTFADPTITSVGHSKQGELVLTNSEGSEFLINSCPSALENRCRLKYLLQEAEQDFDLNGQEKGRELMDKEYQDRQPEDSDAGGGEEKNEKEMDEFLKEVEDTVKNAVLSCTTVEEVEQGMIGAKIATTVINGSTDNHVELPQTDKNAKVPRAGVIREEEKSKCTELESGAKTVIKSKECSDEMPGDRVQVAADCNGRPDVGLRVPEGEEEKVILIDSESEDHDDLHLFNSYNYWYISPDLPLDPGIIAGEQLPKENYASGDVSSRLEDLYSNLNLNDTLNETCNDSSTVTLESSINNSTDAETKPADEHVLDQYQSIVPQELINHFVSMTDPGMAVDIDNEMTYHCAYSLPAVALTLGSENWHLLKGTVEALAGDMQYKVRRTVASSLHEFALILGPEVATDYLTPLFDEFIKDLDEVRIGVLKHLAHFLSLISPAKRSEYLPKLVEFLRMDNEWNWRFREELAKQLLSAVSLFKAADAAKHIWAIARLLLSDKVAAVRQMALYLVTEIIKYTLNEAGFPAIAILLVKLAEIFAHSKKWQRRQTYALLCIELLKEEALLPQQFASEVLPHLLDLSWDAVANVRLVVARCLSQHIMLNEYFANPENEHYSGLETVLRRLQADKDKDVRQSADVPDQTELSSY